MNSVTGPLASLYAQGLNTKRETYQQSSSLSVNGEDVVNKVTGYGVSLTWTLPDKAPLQAVFGKEKTHHKVIKVFKREMQTGDKAFDDIVYVETSTKPQTAKFLENPASRASILATVQAGGSISIKENEVIYDTTGETPEQAEPDEEEMARFLELLLAA